jgi:hypothetical protein
MRFWDSSAVVPLLVEEASSGLCRDLRRGDPRMGVWTLTRTEIVSALRRREREGEMEAHGVSAALRRLARLELEWHEVEDVPAVRRRAEALLARHPLQAADSLQLGAALLLVDDKPRRRPLVTLDRRLGEAADAEGFAVVYPRP